MSGRLGLYWMLAGRVLGWIAGFGAILIAARVLGTHSFGAFSIVMAVWGLVYEGIELGYPRLLIRDIALQPEPGPYLGTVLFLKFIAALPLSVFLAVLASFSPHPFLRTGLLWLIPAALVLPFYTTPGSIAQSFQEWPWAMVLDAGMPVLWGGGMLGVWVFGISSDLVWLPLTGAVIACGLGGALWIGWRIGFAQPRSALASSLWIETLAIGGAILLGSFYNKFDLFILRTVLPAEEHSRYAAACMLYLNGIGFANVWNTSIYPVLTSHPTDVVHRRSWVETRHTFGMLAAVAAGYCTAQADWFGRLVFGDSFGGMGGLLLLFFCLLPIQVGNIFLDGLLVARQRSTVLLRITATGFAVSLLGGIIALPRWGVPAAVLLRFSVESVVGGLKLWAIRDMAPPFRFWPVVTEVSCWLATGIVTAGGTLALGSVRAWLGVVWVGFIGTAVLSHLHRRYVSFVNLAGSDVQRKGNDTAS